MGKLDGRVALITGASRGIGAATARLFAAEGAQVALASRSGDDLGIDGALARPCDVRKRDEVFALTQAAVEQFGRLDIAVANAGVGGYAPFTEMDPEMVERMVDVNLKGTLWTAQATLPHLAESGAGDFVSLASVAGLRGLPGEAVYCASKFGQVGFTRAIDHEMRERGVRCTNVAPGGVATDFAMGEGRTPDMPELKTMMSAEEVAEVVLFVVTRPRDFRMLDVAFRPSTEASWG
jgi:3-oxoacyl-[acyl-carrier protein] reductase